MRCESARRQLQDRVEGELPAAAAAELDAHARRCAECAAALATWQRLFVALDDLPRDDAPPDLTAAVLARLAGSIGRAQPAQPARPRRRHGRVAGLAGAAAIWCAVWWPGLVGAGADAWSRDQWRLVWRAGGAFADGMLQAAWVLGGVWAVEAAIGAAALGGLGVAYRAWRRAGGVHDVAVT